MQGDATWCCDKRWWYPQGAKHQFRLRAQPSRVFGALDRAETFLEWSLALRHADVLACAQHWFLWCCNRVKTTGCGASHGQCCTGAPAVKLSTYTHQVHCVPWLQARQVSPIWDSSIPSAASRASCVNAQHLCKHERPEHEQCAVSQGGPCLRPSARLCRLAEG